MSGGLHGCSPEPRPGTHSRIPETLWGIVLDAKKGEPEVATAALAKLCEIYWYPIYAFLRRKGYQPHEAQDLTQGFFTHLLQVDWLSSVGPEKGFFRTYLLRCLTNFVGNELAKQRCATRRPGGGLVSLEEADAENRYSKEPIDYVAPDKLFERRWVSTLVDQAKAKLRAEWQAAGKLAQYERLEPELAERTERGAVAELARALGLSEGAARVSLHRLRNRFGELLREVIAQTIANPTDVEREIRHLFRAWS